jgi:hypothetical protein
MKYYTNVYLQELSMTTLNLGQYSQCLNME